MSGIHEKIALRRINIGFVLQPVFIEVNREINYIAPPFLIELCYKIT